MIEFGLWGLVVCAFALVFWLGVCVGRAAAWREGVCHILGGPPTARQENSIEQVKVGNTVTNVIKRKRE